MNKERLFRSGVKALRSISDLKEDIYVCPICLRGFDKGSIETKELTLEHVPQNSIGGKPILLTCNQCNSEAGYSIDAELDKREKLHSIPKAIGGLTKFEGRIILNMGGVTINTNAKIEKGNVRFDIPEEINDPEKRNKLFNHLEELTKGGWNKEKFNIQSIIKYHKHKVKVAFLKSAYLAAFASLGYKYILREELSLVRKQILSSDEIIVPNIFLSISDKQPKERKIIYLQQPVESVLVQIDHALIFLPPIKQIEEPYNKIDEYISNRNGEKELSGKDLSWPKGMHLALDNFSPSSESG